MHDNILSCLIFFILVTVPVPRAEKAPSRRAQRRLKVRQAAHLAGDKPGQGLACVQ
jgi:hypothetical protein